MTVGDVLEMVVAVLAPTGVMLVVAGLVSWVVAAGSALLLLCVILMYLAQVWASAEVAQSEPEDLSSAGR